MQKLLNTAIAIMLLTGAGIAQTDGEVKTEDVLALMEESREHYVAGQFEKAQIGFEEVVKIEPENTEAKMYLRQLLERDARNMEKSGLAAVRAAWDTSMILRTYFVSPDAAQSMGLNGSEKPIAVNDHFPEVSFPKGATAVYHPSTGKIFVRNTRENLVVVEEILTSLDVTKRLDDVDQVEIEAKFLEVSEGTLEELGFEWRSFDGQDISIAGDWNYDGKQYLFNDTLRGGETGRDMPFSRPDSLSEGETAASGPGSAFRFEDTFNEDPAYMKLQFKGGTPIDVVISALDQSSGTDVLSAPRVVTKNGKKALIRVGDIHQYPEIYEVGASEGNIVHVRYEDFSERLLGVELEVTPQINGDQIELGLHPKVTELLGWQTYSVAPADSSYTYFQWRLGLEFDHDPVVARLPVYKTREIQTEVTIADGSTIGMGGLISEKVEAFDDRVPFLGSIPLLGRLFRNEGERIIKQNLIMFVTARKVDPNGQMLVERSFETTQAAGLEANAVSAENEQ